MSVRIIATACALLMLPNLSAAQNAPGRDWSGSWGFQTANDRSVGLSRANTMRQASQPPASNKNYVYNTNNYANDNRSNYVDVSTTGSVTTDFQIGDEIGQNTNAVGSMNTGNTTIDINGNNNDINAINSADNSGCVDGSALTSTMTGGVPPGSLGLGWASTEFASASTGALPGMGSFGSIASPLQDCRN